MSDLLQMKSVVSAGPSSTVLGRITRVAVIIPYFQRQSGILAVALKSVVDQVLSSNIHIHITVVDDSSPLPPDDECNEVVLPDHVSLTIVRRPNGGPAAARNSGLDHVPADADLIALLDSDDAWEATHLEQAEEALTGDCDLYFCDHHRPYTSESHFAIVAREYASQVNQSVADARTSLSPLFEVEPEQSGETFIYSGAAALRALSRAYIAHPSTLVFRKALLGYVRFDEDLRSAGEDYLYTFRLAAAARKVALCTKLNVARGVGVSIYESAISWNHPRNLLILLDNCRCTSRAENILQERNLVDRRYRLRVRERQMIFIYAWCRRIFINKRVDMTTLKLALQEDVWLLARAPAMMITFLSRKALRRSVIGPGY